MNFTQQPVQSIIESVHYPEWTVGNWKIIFMFSERLLAEIRKFSRESDWYEDPVIAATYIDRANVCFTSIEEYYSTFGILPQIGDRLYDHDTGMQIEGRSIDGHLKTITFTLTL